MPQQTRPLKLTDCIPVPSQCEGCKCLRYGNPYKAFISCSVYASPTAIWRLMNGSPCPMASHIKVEADRGLPKRRVGQQKQKKVK